MSGDMAGMGSISGEATMCAKVRGEKQYDWWGEPELGVAVDLRVWVSHEEMGPRSEQSPGQGRPHASVWTLCSIL